MTEIVREAGHLTGTGVTVVPEPSTASAEAALRSGDLDVVLVNDTEVVVKQVSLAGRADLQARCRVRSRTSTGLTKLVGQLPPWCRRHAASPCLSAA